MIEARKSFLVSVISIGTLLEWAEYTFYGYMAVSLSSLFFPQNLPQIAILKTYGIFAAGYIMRPLGAIIFGHIGDTYGRKIALMLSLLLMGAATFAIGCLPTFLEIGQLAPITLLILRMLQGIAISGEYNGAGIFLVEKSKSQYPCLAGSWVSASAAAGMVLGGLAAFSTSLPSAAPWAWRVPFLLGGVSCFLGLWLRKGVNDSAVFTKQKLIPFFEIFRSCKKSLLIVGAIAAFTGVFVYIGNIYIVTFLKQQANLPTHHATFFAIFGEVIVTLLIPIMAYVADKTDAYRQYRWGLILVALGSPFIFILCSFGNYWLIGLAMVLFGILDAIVCGPMVKILFDQFPSNLRYTGISFAWSFAAAIFGGTSPMVAQFLSTKYQWMLGPSFYVSLVALVAFWIFTVSLSEPLKYHQWELLKEQNRHSS
ncbi:MAG: MFS transporter [Candidatus Berkiella sp.]